MAVCGTETVEAALELPDPSPEGGASLLDFTLEALLPGTLPPAAISFVPILGALSSVSQLHWKMESVSVSVSARLQEHVHVLVCGSWVWVWEQPYPEKLAQARVVRLAWLSLRVLQIFCEPEAQDLEHAVERFVRGAYRYKGIGGVEIVPVFEIGGGLEQLGGQRKADRRKIGNTDEPGEVQERERRQYGWGGGKNAEGVGRSGRARGTNFLRMPIKMRSLELSL